MLREFAISDTLPADAVDIIGAANEPTGWRGGTGNEMAGLGALLAINLVAYAVLFCW
jgi:hypothetical protein